MAFVAVAGVPATMGLRHVADNLALIQARVEVNSSARGDPFETNESGGYKKYRQVMINYGDVQYVSFFDIGQQTITGIFDSGSFELTVFSRTCYTCGAAAKYDATQSPYHRTGTLMSGQSYGSGDTWSQDAFDVVSIGPYDGVNQSFWEVYRADMPVLFNSGFQSIIGIGPPETPAADAWEAAESAAKDVSDLLAQGVEAPPSLISEAERKMHVAMEMMNRTTLLQTLGSPMFSLCIGKKPNSDGYMVWNDTSAEENPELFVKVPVIGNHTWSVQMQSAELVHYGNSAGQPIITPHVRAGQPIITPLGCENGCSALLDSGTSLLAMPSNVVNFLVNTISSRTNANCSNMQDLPNIEFHLAGQRFSLPPDVYVAEVDGSVPGYLQSFLRVRNIAAPGSKCELLVMESNSQTEYGPLWIFGLPFFRKYYTTFKIGSSHSDRAILIANASETCQPAAKPLPLPERAEQWKRKVDPANLWVPLTVQKAMKSDYVLL
jgi:hypothetical protein